MLIGRFNDFNIERNGPSLFHSSSKPIDSFMGAVDSAPTSRTSIFPNSSIRSFTFTSESVSPSPENELGVILITPIRFKIKLEEFKLKLESVYRPQTLDQHQPPCQKEEYQLVF